ncbi:amidohydrolase [Arthrobacter sp. Soil782]|uniref:amidohydrolase n=1 Tax=Arthrobacter sp. Soil782 TaxID=1736410 RepID=UPI000AC09519|nr:amidohydrolase family protein [Arthrobacter sp. Soil782]
MSENDRKPILYRNGSVYSAADPFATAMLVTGDTVAWVGSEHAAASLADSTMVVIDLQGALIAPGFVDSHFHTTETGLALTSLDLTEVNSLGELLELIAGAAASIPGTIMGNGWDESRWSERRPPTAAELDNASGGRDVYLVRADVHSAVVSASLAQRLALHTYSGWDNGFVVREAHLAARTAVRSPGPAERTTLQRTALDNAAANGIVAVVEMAAAHIAPREDVLSLLSLDGAHPEVLAYWGQAVTSEEELRSVLAGFDGRVLGLGGDLNVDGSIGSHTARMRVPYADAPHSSGTAFMHADDVASHLGAATAAGRQAGFHVIGDEGLDTVIAGLEKAAAVHGIEKVRAARHRLEHVEMADDESIRSLVHFGAIVSAQSGFDALWGAPGGLYEQRLGRDRYVPMNRVGSLLSQGVPVCLGSDSPVTRMSPWQSVRACMTHASPEERISARAAFIAHTRAGWRAVGAENPLLGQLVPGAPASYAVWEVDELMVQTPDSRVQSWSTDPRAGTPLLPALDTGSEPRCLETVHHGRQLFTRGGLDAR